MNVDRTDSTHQLTQRDLFEIVVREHHDMLLAYLRSMVVDAATADDLFQETMLTAWRNLAQFDRTRPIGPWLRGIARRLALSTHRTATRRQALLASAVADHVSRHFDQIDAITAETWSEKVSAIHDCLAALPEDFARVIRLKYWNLADVTTIAGWVSASAETVKKRLQRGRARLLECLQRKGVLAET